MLLFLPLFKEAIIDTYSYSDIFCKVVRLVHFGNFVFNILFKSFVELAYKRVFTLTNIGGELFKVRCIFKG
jgi:hypothetical protein